MRKATPNLRIVIGVAALVLPAAVGALVWWTAPPTAFASDLARAWQAPTTTHPLGCDPLGRDILLRLLAGTGTSLAIVAAVLGLALPAALAAGLAASATRAADAAVSAVIDAGFGIPELVAVLLLTTALGPGFWTVVLALTWVLWPGHGRAARGHALHVWRSGYVLAARAAGAGPGWILMRHVLPEVAVVSAVRAAAGLGPLILAEAALGFLGFGVPEPLPSLGGLLRDGTAQGHALLTTVATLTIAVLSGAALLLAHCLARGASPTDEG